MAITGKIRSVRANEGIECQHCSADAAFSVESNPGVFGYYCKDHYDDLRYAVVPVTKTPSTISVPEVKSVLVEQITLF